MISGHSRAALLCGLLVAVNLAVWSWARACLGDDGMLLGTALLAYAFGLRHAVDADHIAAIDNATRKLIEGGRSATATGFFFSLGHASVVVLASLALGLGAEQAPALLAAVKPLAGGLATGLSAASLLVLAAANSAILVSLGRQFAASHRSPKAGATAARPTAAARGPFGWLLRGAFRLISRSWHMYPLGLVFGLGFDTASEIGLLALAASQSAHGLPLAAVMVFPALFAAGMVLVDTLDALLMVGAYRWALSEPLRKLRYNMAITAISVIVAAAIGGVELLGAFADDTGSGEGVSSVVAQVDSHLAAIGVTMIALCTTAWLLSKLISRLSAARSG